MLLVLVLVKSRTNLLRNMERRADKFLEKETIKGKLGSIGASVLGGEIS